MIIFLLHFYPLCVFLGLFNNATAINFISAGIIRKILFVLPGIITALFFSSPSTAYSATFTADIAHAGVLIPSFSKNFVTVVPGQSVQTLMPCIAASCLIALL